MMVRVQVFQAFARCVRVDLRSRAGAVSKQHLHDAQVGTAATSFCLAGCAVTSPIQPASSSKSAFEGAV
jgi:hypothetical protein